MDRLNLSGLGERLKTSGAQVSRIVTGKVKEILQTPTPESKMVDEATSETLEEPNWGMNLRICGMINSEEFSGSEVVKAIKRKVGSKSVVSQGLALELLEVCAMNCEKVFSEVASEKLLEEMVKLIHNPETENGNRIRALQLIRAWGESEDLAYLPVFRQTYMSIKGRDSPPLPQDGDSPHIPYSLESYVHQQPVSPPERYPIPEMGSPSEDSTTYPYGYAGVSVEEKKEYLVIARNSLELLSSILSSGTDRKAIKDDLTVSLVEKCKQSQPIVQRIVETTTDDEGMLFEALYLHDELQQVISRYKEMEAGLEPQPQRPENAEPTDSVSPATVTALAEAVETKIALIPKADTTNSPFKVEAHNETGNAAESSDVTESRGDKRSIE